MTPCDLCGQPCEVEGCDRCLGYAMWATGTSAVDKSDRRRNLALGRARADLVALPDLLETLAMCLTEKTPSVGNGGKVTGSPAPLRLDVLHLADERRKPGWEGEDPRITKLGERYGVVATLESWTRVVCEEIGPDRPEMAEVATVRTEASVLIEVWDWIEEQQWAEELAEDASKLTKKVRAALGIRPEYQPRCRYCRNKVQPVDADRKLTTWEACAYGLCTGCGATYPPGPALVALAQVQKPMKLKDAAEALGLPLRTLQRWVTDGLIRPAPDSEGKRRGRLFDLAEVRVAASKVHGRLTA